MCSCDCFTLHCIICIFYRLLALPNSCCIPLPLWPCSFPIRFGHIVLTRSQPQSLVNHWRCHVDQHYYALCMLEHRFFNLSSESSTAVRVAVCMQTSGRERIRALTTLSCVTGKPAILHDFPRRCRVAALAKSPSARRFSSSCRRRVRPMSNWRFIL